MPPLPLAEPDWGQAKPLFPVQLEQGWAAPCPLPHSQMGLHRACSGCHIVPTSWIWPMEGQDTVHPASWTTKLSKKDGRVAGQGDFSPGKDMGMMVGS